MPEEDSIAPALLIAMPQLLDPNFHRTVVLLVEHHAAGTLGIVLNREAELTLPEICTSLGFAWEGDDELPAGWGGPVQPTTGWMLFSSAPACDPDLIKQVSAGIYFGGTLAVLEEIARHPPERVRFFLGYAGWGAGQLERELAEGAWILAPVSSKAVFDVPCDMLWEHVLHSLGVDPSRLVSTAGIH
jgi:putative transcriptional regulator